MQLTPNTLLQSGNYRIIRVLGQGGFGITYEAEQVALHRKVAIKEFFMKDCCDRDEASSRMTVGTGSQRELVEKFRGKFIREAQMIAGFEHPHIVRVLDVFEENGTAYYVMDNLTGGSLKDRIESNGPLSEKEAERYVRQMAEALDYIHSHHTVHLDVKPSNILLNSTGDAFLVDFGISKHYDNASEQTSSTPVGSSKGFAPLEQARNGDVSQFGPSTDIYALGATLYNLLTGKVPQEATDVYENGLARPEGISDRMWRVIESAMQPRKKDRPQTITAFLSLLDSPSVFVQDKKDETKVVIEKQRSIPVDKAPITEPGDKIKPKISLLALLGGIAVAALVLTLVLRRPNNKNPYTEETPITWESGSLKVASTPPGASIWLDGEDTKRTTPDILEDITPGQHSIRLALKDHKDFSGTVTISSGKRSELNRTLSAEASLHSSLLEYESLVLLSSTSRNLIRIDKMQDGTFRYAAWPSGQTMKDAPAIVVKEGEYDERDAKWVFKNNGYEYHVTRSNVSVIQNGEVIKQWGFIK